MHGAPQHAGPMGGAGPVPPKKKGNTCLTIFLVVTGLFVVSIAVGGYLLYDEFGELIGATGELTAEMSNAQQAPGTDELREKGCTLAMALDVGKIGDAIQRMEKDIAKREGREPKEMDLGDAGMLVLCQTDEDVECKDIAEAYVDGAKPDAKFLVSVKDSSEKVTCSGLFDEDGEFVEDVEDIDMPFKPN